MLLYLCDLYLYIIYIIMIIELARVLQVCLDPYHSQRSIF